MANMDFKKFIKGFGVPVGILTVLLCSVNSLEIVRNTVASSGNETILIDNINATGELLKRAGEFASRSLWMRKGRFVLPAGTILTLAPKITIPAFRRKAFKGGLNSDFQATWYFYLNCDKMGFTHDMHPFPFDRPPFYPFGSLMRPIESKDYPGQEKDKDKDKDKDKPMQMKPIKHMMYGPPQEHEGEYVTIAHGPPSAIGEAESYKSNKGDKVYTFFPIHKRTGEEQKSKIGHGSRKPRSIMSLPPPDNLPGGERAILLPSIENMMANFGYEGKGCMLRAICEIHEFPMQEGYGLVGEMIALFFSVSQSPYAESHMPEYLKAEQAGRSGGCASYRKLCAKSVFKWEMEKRQLPLLGDKLEKANEIISGLVSPFKSKFQSESDDHEL